MSIRYQPLTPEQLSRLAPGGDRVWTDFEKKIIARNCKDYDMLKYHFFNRCRMPDCRYLILSSEAANAIPNIGEVCNACYQMYQAVQSIKWNNKQ